ncbi:MAG: hypothetical protein AB7O97_23610 [Planctomycetota bacterium]
MSETTMSLDVPQISLARYFDLLKRRRWQVIPVSLLGLLIGGVVAFLIPRYYVAQTKLEYYRLPAEKQSAGLNEDPYKFVVNNATVLIPRAVEETMRKLGWSEALVPDPYERRERVREVEERVRVDDLNADERRTYASILVTYRDRDGMRAAAFLNELVRTFMSQRLDEMRRSAERQRVIANDAVREATGERNRISHDITQLSLEYGFERLWDPSVVRDDMRTRSEVSERQRELLAELVGEVAKLQKELDATQQKLDTTQRVLEPTAEAILAGLPPGSPAAFLFQMLQQDKRSLETVMGEAHPLRATTLERVQRLEQELQALIGAGTDELLNPAIEKLREQQRKLQADLAAAEARRDAVEAQIAAAETKRQRQLGAIDGYMSKQLALDEADKKVDEAQEQLRNAIGIQTMLDTVPPIKQIGDALVPRTPTEPSIWLLAILGCALGLGAAVALILILDVIRGTLKTVDDVERALPVPMLGGVSYLETQEERARASRTRRRASLVAGLILVGAVVVVTTYYVAPHRLPPFARNLLSIVLGG